MKVLTSTPWRAWGTHGTYRGDAQRAPRSLQASALNTSMSSARAAEIARDLLGQWLVRA